MTVIRRDIILPVKQKGRLDQKLVEPHGAVLSHCGTGEGGGGEEQADEEEAVGHRSRLHATGGAQF